MEASTTAWVRFGGMLAYADGVLGDEERSAIKSVAVARSGLLPDDVEAVLRGCEGASREAIRTAISGLSGLPRARTLDLLADCYRIITADGELHPGETGLLSDAISHLFGAANVEPCLSWLKANDTAATLRAELEHAE